jgi:hypothetical protein
VQLSLRHCDLIDLGIHLLHTNAHFGAACVRFPFVRHQDMQGERGGIFLLILNLGTRWMWLSVSPSDDFTPGEKAPVIHWILGWVGPGAGNDVSERTSLTSVRIRTPNLPARSLVTILTELSRISARGKSREFIINNLRVTVYFLNPLKTKRICFI